MYINTQYYEAYREDSAHAEALGAAVRWCGYFQCGPKYRVEKISERYFIIYVLHGIGYITDETGERTTIQAGDVMMFRPHSYQNIVMDENAPMVYAGIIFNGAFFDRLLTFSPLLTQQKIAIGVNMELAMGFRNLISEMDTLPAEADDMILAKCIELIAEINQMIRTAYQKVDVEWYNQQCAEKLAAHIRKNYARKISLDELVKVSGLSKSWVNVLFNRVYNVSPIKFQMQLRIERAKVLLADNVLGIGEISNSLGFVDQCYMSKVFKRYTGKSPKEYRNSLQHK